MFHINRWTFIVHEGTIATAEEIDSISKEIGLSSLPIMTYPNSKLSIMIDDFTLQFDTKTFLSSIIKDMRLRNDKETLFVEVNNPYWRNSPLKKVQFHDWTFWPQNILDDVIFFKQPIFTEDSRFTSTHYPLLYSKHLMFYEDELDDNGIISVDIRVRCMQFGFLIRQRSLLIVDGQFGRCRDVRYYHIFGDDLILKTIEFREASGSFKIKDLILDPTILPLVDVIQCLSSPIIKKTPVS